MQNDTSTPRSLFARLSRWKAARFIIIALLFAIWMMLFDPYGYFPARRLRGEIRALELQENLYLDRIADDRRKIDELHGGKDKLEKFAREQFRMKRPDEDLFILEDD
ncbi:MAG: septum formation initiator family protein [Odoribacteraceae bacterium]|jgi:cell division protein FtsB|nr:septum formation initiator family protein [Odoribacteraceae bacterium]